MYMRWLRRWRICLQFRRPRVQSLGQEDPLEKGMAIHSSILAWRIPWTEEPGGLQSMGSQRVGHNWATNNEKEGSPRFLSYINDDYLPSPCRRRAVCWETRNKRDCRSEDTRHKNGHQNQEPHNLKVYVLNRKTSPKSSFLTSSRILVV